MNTVSTAEMANKIKFATMANFHEFCEEFCDRKEEILIYVFSDCSKLAVDDMNSSWVYEEKKS